MTPSVDNLECNINMGQLPKQNPFLFDYEEFSRNMNKVVGVELLRYKERTKMNQFFSFKVDLNMLSQGTTVKVGDPKLSLPKVSPLVEGSLSPLWPMGV